MLTQFIFGVFREWAQSLYQRLRRDKYTINARNFLYAFIRAADCQIFQALTTYVVIGDIVMGKEGLYYLSNDTIEGINPLVNYSPNVPGLLRRESAFRNCPDIIVNTHYDPQTGELTGFENQIGHHGGLGGLQSFPFLMYPSQFDKRALPIVLNCKVNLSENYVHRAPCRPLDVQYVNQFCYSLMVVDYFRIHWSVSPEYAVFRQKSITPKGSKY
jgi:hypothetical protein